MKIDRSKIRFVDGFKVRNHLDIEFNILHGHGKNISQPQFKFYIPEGEWWCSEVHRAELDFIVQIEEFYYEWPEDMETFTEFRKYQREKLCLPPPVPDFIKEKMEVQGRQIVYVDGAIIRRYFDPEFVVGGHRFVYDYIPAGEIWVDSVMEDKKELPYFITHEITEYNLMEQDKDYEAAHDFANAAEKEQRRRDGVGAYPFEPNYPWKGMGNEELVKQFYV